MSQRRISQNNRLMFVTTCTKDRMPIFADDTHARTVIECLYFIQGMHPFFLYAFVIMPDHCHFLLHVPKGGSISKIMAQFKRSAAFAVGRPIWQKRFYVKHISNPGRCIEYIHRNPVKGKICAKAEDYAWSSASGRWDVSELGLE
jgi:putative transposase